MLEQIVKKSNVLTQAVLIMSALINIIFLTNYTYNFEKPEVVIVERDPMAWLKETVNFAGFVQYEAPVPIIIDPWQIRIKNGNLAMLINLLSILNGIFAIFAFLLNQLK
jgi:hypothetical protein